MPTIAPAIPLSIKLKSFCISSTFEIPPDAITGIERDLANFNVSTIFTPLKVPSREISVYIITSIIDLSNLLIRSSGFKFN